MNTIIRRSLNFNRAFVKSSTPNITNKSYIIRNFSTENKEAEKKPEENKTEPQEDIIKKLQEELEETKKQLLYTAADRENVRRFLKEENEKVKKFGIQSFAKDLLEVVDQLEMATSQFPQEKLDTNKELKDLHEGVKMTENLFMKILGNNGVTRYDPLGEKFDYNNHHAIYEMEDPTKEPGTVGNVVKKGYLINNRIVRPAMVAVVKAKK